MADPKYANLPGIDFESKDLYECGDLPEDDQNWKPDELESTSVEKVHVDTQAAFEKFSSKYVTGQMNFSDQKKIIGYKNITSAEDETILQKYNRLKLEVADLSKQIGEMKTAKKDSDADVQLLDKVKSLEGQLLTDDVQSLQNDSMSKEIDVEKAMSSIKNIKSKESGAGDSKQAKSDGSYEVYLKSEPDQRSMEQYFQLEQRLSKLESTVGASDKDDMHVLAKHSNSGTLLEAVQMMETKLNLLDPEKLPLVDTRLQAILVKINEINKTKKVESSAERNKKIDDLYNMVQRWDGVCSALPKIQKRLMDLSVVQTKASSFLTNLQHLETVHEKLSSELSKTEVCQSTLQDMLKSNLETVQANITAVNKRFEALKE